LADKTGYQSSAGRARPKLQRAATRNHACTLISEYKLGHVCPPIDGLIPVATWNPVFAAFLFARNRPKYQTVAGWMTRIRSTDGRRVNATFVRHGWFTARSRRRVRSSRETNPAKTEIWLPEQDSNLRRFD
jgi:hypothetical protein